MEVLVSMGILLALMVVVLANYRRGNDDSSLNRETSLLIANIRFAQEQTAAGQTIKFCGHNIGDKCEKNSDCSESSSNPNCMLQNDLITPWPLETPKGGYGLLLSCYSPGNYSKMPWIQYGVNNPNNKFAYYVYADNRKCDVDLDGNGVPLGSNCCFPLDMQCLDWEGPTATDGRISDVRFGPPYVYKGDTQQLEAQLPANVIIKDFRLTRYIAGATSTIKNYYCNAPDNVYKRTPWVNETPPDVQDSTVPNDYPLQLLIRFLPPDGRTVRISDNVADFPPRPDSSAGVSMPDIEHPWLQADIMLGLKNRSMDCKVVSITKEGVISQSVDADCQF